MQLNTSIVQKSRLEGATRIDAEYYQPEYLELIKTLDRNTTTTLGSFSTRITQGPNPIFTSEGKICLNGRNVKNLRVNPDDSNCVSNEEFSKLANFKVRKGDILITLKGLGSIGKTAYVFEDMEAIFSRDVGLIRTGVDSEFLFAFLLSKYGVFQIERSTTGGTGQLTLTTNNIRQFKVPKFNSKTTLQIAHLIQESEKIYRSSLNYYEVAENLLLEELGLTDFQQDNSLSFVINFSEVHQAERIDADYFQSNYIRLLEKIKQHNSARLTDLASLKKGVEPGSELYREEGKLFIRVSNISKNGIIDKDQKYISNDMYEQLKNEFEPKIGEILLTKDATPGIAYTLKESIEGILAGGILRLKLKEDIDAEYLALCINSIIGQFQVERDAGGSIIAHWRPEQIKNLLIPVLPKNTQQKIADLVRQSHEARKKSKELLEEAKRKVEEIIEKGEL